MSCCLHRLAVMTLRSVVECKPRGKKTRLVTSLIVSVTFVKLSYAFHSPH